MNASIFDSALSDTRRSDVSEKKKKIACPLLAKFACGQVSSPRLYRLIIISFFLTSLILMTDLKISIIPSSVIIWCVESYSGTFSFWSVPDNPLRTVKFSSAPLNSNSSHEKLNSLTIFVFCLLFEVSNRLTTSFELGKIKRKFFKSVPEEVWVLLKYL